jgi:arabinofuranan 3-O-arabinosyltransferase
MVRVVDNISTQNQEDLQISRKKSFEDQLSSFADRYLGFKGLRFDKRAIWGIYLAVLIVFLLQAPGREVFDTKLDLIVNPVGLMSSLLHVWDGARYQGYLQDQYIGYAFPMGPFFAIGSLMSIPMWIVQRLWMSAVFTVAFWGMIRLLEELDIGSGPTRLFGALAFALYPTFTILIGSTSYEILPGALLPLYLLPLVKGTKGGSVARAGLTSASVVLFMGGVNATATAVNMLLPLMYLLTRKFNQRTVGILKWWLFGTALAVLWWLLPLLFLGGYGFNFLPYVEQARTTTSTMSATEVLRGAGNWTAYLDFGFLKHTATEVLAGGGDPNPTLDASHPWIQAGWVIAVYPIAIIGSCILGALGLAGMALRNLKEATWLRISLALCAIYAMAGYWGHFGGPLSSEIQKILNGPLAPLRNIYKIEPSIAVILVIALVQLSVIINHNLKLRWNKHRKISAQMFSFGLVVILLVSISIPYLTGKVLNGNSFTSIPGYWTQVADFLNNYSPNEPALLIPASSQGMYLWGTTVDEPLEPLAKSPWTTEDIVPYGGAGNRRYLDAIENAFSSGNAFGSMGTYLARAGITYLIVRNDLNWQASGSPSPAKVHQVLNQIGFVPVANFGPNIPSQDYITSGINGTTPKIAPTYPAVQIYTSQANLGNYIQNYPVVSLPTSKTVLVSGGPGSLMQLTSQGLIKNQPVILTGNSIPKGVNIKPVWISTDTLRKQQIDFGQVNSNSSYTLTATENAPLGSPGITGGGQVKQILPFAALNHQTVAVITGVKSLSASSYGSWYFTLPQDGPFAAFDGDAKTAWVAGSVNGSVGQWIQANLTQPDNVSQISVEMLVDNNPQRQIATSLTVSTNNGSITTPIKAVNSPQFLNVPPGKSTFIRITVAGARGGIPGGPGVGIREINIPGIVVQRYLATPADVAPNTTSEQAFSLSTEAQSVNFTSGAAYPALARIITLQQGENVNISGQALPVPSVALDNMLAPNSQVKISTNSTYANLPRFNVNNLLNPTASYAWIAGNNSAVLNLSWTNKTKISQIRFRFTSNFAANPLSVKIETPVSVQTVNINKNGFANFNPIYTNSMQLSFPKVQKLIAVNQLTGEVGQLPVGLSGLEIPALKKLMPKALNLNQKFNLSCGQGPPLEIDGATYQTSVNGTLGKILQAEPVNLKVCVNNPIPLSKGVHFIVNQPSNIPFSISSLAIAPAGLISSPNAITQLTSNRTVQVNQWQDEHRAITIGPGTQSYLEIHENYNKGWQATLNGQILTPVTLDGWQQGFVVPAGEGGQIILTYLPDFLYNIVIAIGIIAVIILLVLLTLTLFGKINQSQDFEESAPNKIKSKAIFFVIGLITAFLIGGPALIVVPIVAFISYKTSDRYMITKLAFISLTLAGIISAIDIGLNAQSGVGSFGYVAQILSIFALSCALLPSFDKDNQIKNWLRN